METSTDEEEISEAWANFALPLENDCDRQSVPTVRLLSQVDKEDQEASSQRKVSPISTQFLSSLTLNFQRIFFKKIRQSEWKFEESELIEAPAKDDFELLDHCLYSDEEVESDDECEPIYFEEEDEDEIDMSHENIGFRVTSKDLFHEFQGKKEHCRKPI